MKFGKMEGTPEEIRDFFQNNGLNIEDYLEKPDTPISWKWSIIPVFLIVASIIGLTLVQHISKAIQTFLFVFGCGGGLWLAVIIQIRFKNTWAAGFIAIGIVLLMLIAIGTITPIELLENIRLFKN